MARGYNRPKIRVIKQRPRRKNAANQIYDEDVLRWRHQVSEPEAFLIARQAGLGVPCLPTNEAPATVITEPSKNAVTYIHSLPEDARRVLYKHCEMVSRHQRMLLEGQERLRYVQAQIKEMKARIPPAAPPPSAHREPEPKIRGPRVKRSRVANPTCWASCCGVFELPEGEEEGEEEQPGQQGMPPGGRGGPAAAAPVMVVQIPKPAYFRELAQKRVEEARRLRRKTEESEGGGQTTQSGGGGKDETAAARSGTDGGASTGGGSVVRPVTASVGGASDAPPPASGEKAAAGTTGVSIASDPVAQAAELPGQLDALAADKSSADLTESKPQVELAAAQPPPAAAEGPAAALSTSLSGPGRPALAPLQGKAPGTPQSLLRPLAPLPPPPLLGPRGRGGLRGSSGGGGGGAAGRGRKASPLAPLKGTAGARVAASEGGAASEDATGAAAATEKAAAATAAAEPDVGELTLRPAATIAAATVGAAAEQAPPPPPAPPEFDLSRYQDPESLRKITKIQAVQRGRMARKEVAARRAAQPRSPAQPAAGTATEGYQSQPSALASELGESTTQGVDSERLNVNAAEEEDPKPSIHPFADPAFGAPETLAAAHGGGGGQADTGTTAGGSPPFDLSRYQDPESLKKITTIQAAQRGRMARREAAARRAARGPVHGAGRLPPQQDLQQDLQQEQEQAALLAAEPAVVMGAQAEMGAADEAPQRLGTGAAGHDDDDDVGDGGGGGGGGPGAASSSSRAPPHAYDGVTATDTGDGLGPGTAPGSEGTGRRPEFDLSRYQDPESLRKITTIQAAQRGRMARKEAAARRATRGGGAAGVPGRGDTSTGAALPPQAELLQETSF